jgi:hypothetical protein
MLCAMRFQLDQFQVLRTAVDLSPLRCTALRLTAQALNVESTCEIPIKQHLFKTVPYWFFHLGD